MGSFKEISFNFNFLHKSKKPSHHQDPNDKIATKNMIMPSNYHNVSSSGTRGGDSCKGSDIINGRTGSNNFDSRDKEQLRKQHRNGFSSSHSMTVTGDLLASINANTINNKHLSSTPDNNVIQYNDMNQKTNSVVSIITNSSDTTSGSSREFNFFNTNYRTSNSRPNKRDRNNHQSNNIITKKQSFNSSSSAMSTSATSSPMSEVSRRMRDANNFDSYSKSSSTSQATNNGASNSDSESDSDWDDDDDDLASKKINIKIKPLSQMTPSKLSASVDELRATVEAWRPLANLNTSRPSNRRHHKSTNLPLPINGINLNGEKNMTSHQSSMHANSTHQTILQASNDGYMPRCESLYDLNSPMNFNTRLGPIDDISITNNYRVDENSLSQPQRTVNSDCKNKDFVFTRPLPVPPSTSRTNNLNGQQSFPSSFSQFDFNTSSDSVTTNQSSAPTHPRSSNTAQYKLELSTIKPSPPSSVLTKDRYADLNELFSDVNSPKNNETKNPILDLLSCESIQPKTEVSTSDSQNFIRKEDDPFGFNQPIKGVEMALLKESHIIRHIPNGAIKVAVAIQESINAVFRGSESQCKVQLLGYVKIAVPANLAKLPHDSTSMPKMILKLENTNMIKKVYSNQEIFTKENGARTDSLEGPYGLDMPSFSRYISNLNRQKPQANYYNIDILRYIIKDDLGLNSSPIQMISYWQCDPNTTKLRVDLKYTEFYKNYGINISDIKDIKFTLKVTGGVTSFQSKPQGRWDPSTCELCWKFEDLAKIVDLGACMGSLLARFHLSSGPTEPSIVNVQFAIQSRSLSGLKLKLANSGYCISLTKSEVRAGRFVCEPQVAT